MDGTLGSQTARMLDGSGVQITSREELAEFIRAGARAGFPVAVHAIGDLANREALDAFEETRDEWHPRGLRQRIEHAQLLTADDLGRFAKLGVAASVQFSHPPSDRDLADRFWADLDSEPYAFRSLLDSGAVLVNGSDAPIEELDPLTGIRAGVLRTLDDRPAWHPEQALTVEEALQATCVTPAWLSGDEHRRGKLLPGYYADLVVLDRDPLACEPEELRRSPSSRRCSAARGRTTARPGTSEESHIRHKGRLAKTRCWTAGFVKCPVTRKRNGSSTGQRSARSVEDARRAARDATRR